MSRRSCPERKEDFGGCPFQAFQLTGDAANADPVCAKSPHRSLIDRAIEAARTGAGEQPLVFRNPRNSRRLAHCGH